MVDVESLALLELVTHKDAASVADACQAAASLQELREQKLALTDQIIGDTLSLVESCSAIPARARRRFQTEELSSWVLKLLESRLAVRVENELMVVIVALRDWVLYFLDQ